jgi:hypothetical protein
MRCGSTPRNCISLVLPIALALSCGTRTLSPARASTEASFDEEGVRFAVLDTIARRVGTSRVVLSGSTWAPGDPMTGVIGERARLQGGAPADMVTDFRARAASERALALPSGARAGIVVVTAAEIMPREGEAADAYWSRFRGVHAPATGWLRITAAGFGQDGSSAMAAAEYRCGIRCGWGVLYTLSRRAGSWHIADELMLWVQ